MHLITRYRLFYLIKRLLISKYTDNNIIADSKSKNDRTPLSLAAERGHETMIRLLINQYNVKLNSKNEGE
jgi:ankyrin repeat protein